MPCIYKSSKVRVEIPCIKLSEEVERIILELKKNSRHYVLGEYMEIFTTYSSSLFVYYLEGSSKVHVVAIRGQKKDNENTNYKSYNSDLGYASVSIYEVTTEKELIEVIKRYKDILAKGSSPRLVKSQIDELLWYQRAAGVRLQK